MSPSDPPVAAPTPHRCTSTLLIPHFALPVECVLAAGHAGKHGGGGCEWEAHVAARDGSRVAAPTPETPSKEERGWVIEHNESLPTGLPLYWRCPTQRLISREIHHVFDPDHQWAVRFARREDAERMIGWLNVPGKAVEHLWLAGAVSHPQPEGKTPLCPQCQRPMTWTATAPVVGARMEWRCFHHADLGTTDGCEVIEVDADGHVSRPVKGPLREGPVAHPVVSPRTET